MKTLAAVLVEHCKPLELMDLEIPPLQPGQVLVELAYSGVCGTQLGEKRGTRGPDKFLPHCLGHEGSGWVRQTCQNHHLFTTGDAVCLSWLNGLGRNVPGTSYRYCGQAQLFSTVNAGAVTTFQRWAVVSENRLTKLPPGFPMKEAALLGCPIPTGVGAVWNTAGARPGQSVAVFGCGGVGLCAIAGAKAAGCYPIVGLDIDACKLEAAHTVGADILMLLKTDAALSADGNGFDIVIECSGHIEAMRLAMAYTVPRGLTVVLGNARQGERLEIDPRWLNDGRQLRGSWGGDSVPERDFPRYMALIQSGRLNLSSLIENVYHLEQINDALEDMASGAVVRPLIDMKESN